MTTSITKIALTVSIAAVAILAAEPALAQFSGGGGDAPFRQGLNTALNWVFIIGVAVALFGFIGACVALFMRNIPGFAGGVLAVIVGGALLANAPTIMQSLTGLQSIL
jgi:hypothetical protein